MVRQKLNVKLVTWTLAILVVLCLGVHLLHGFQAQRHARTLMAQAVDAEGKPDLKLAARCLNRYLLFAPADREALARYGLVLDRMAKTSAERQTALEILERVLARQPLNHDVRRRVVALTMAEGFFTEARVHLKFLLRATPRRGDLEDLLGQCQEAAGEAAAAANSYEKAVAHAPRQIPTYVRLARLLRSALNAPAKADQVMDALVKANGRSPQAVFARAHYRAATDSLEGAAKDLAVAVKLAPEDADVLTAGAELAQLQGDLDEARRVWRRGVKLHPADLRMHLGLAGLELQAGRTNTAVACLRRGLVKLPGNADLLHTLADVLIGQGELAEAGKVIVRLREERGAAEVADYLEGRILIAKKQWGEAARRLAEVCEAARDFPALAGRCSFYLGQCYGQLGYPDLQLDAYHKAVALAPTPAGRTELAAALVAAGRDAEAREQYRALTRMPGAPAGSWTLLARSLIWHNLRMRPDQRAWEEVDGALERAARAPDQAVPVTLLRAEVLLAKEQPDRARALLEGARAKQQGEISLWLALADLAARRGELRKARSILEEAHRRLGDRLELLLARVDLADRQGGAEAGRSLAEVEKRLGKLAGAEQAQLLRRLAETHYRLGNLTQAERLGRELVRLRPRDLGSRVLLFEVVLRTGPDQEVQRVLAGIHLLEGEEGTWWRYGEAARLLLRAEDRSGTGKARGLLEELARRRPTWSRVPLLRAYLEGVEGRPDKALDAYLLALKLGERQADVVVRVVRLLSERGRYLEAEQAVRQFEEQAPITRELARLGAEAALRLPNLDRAAELARQAVAVDATDYREHLWLGEVLSAAGRPREAEEQLGQAARLGGKLPDAWVALVRHLARTDQTDRAVAVIQELPSRVEPRRLLLALAQCYEVLGRMDRAEEQYRLALAKTPDDFLVLRSAAAFYLHNERTKDAEGCLRKLLTSEVVPAESAAWAGRQLALLWAPSGGKKFDLALKLIANNTRRGESVLDRRAHALVLATRPERRRQALKDLEGLISLQPLGAEERFPLARAYEAVGDWARAEVQMLELLAQDRRNPAYLGHYLRGLLRHQQLDEARLWFARLEKVEPASRRTKEIRLAIKRAAQGDREK